jgi:hypothetical protein
MSTLSPPVALEKPENQARVDYIQDYASGKNLILFWVFPKNLSIKILLFLFYFRPWFQLSTRVLWAYRRAVERSRCSTDIWKIKWISTHRLRKIVSSFEKSEITHLTMNSSSFSKQTQNRNLKLISFTFLCEFIVFWIALAWLNNQITHPQNKIFSDVVCWHQESLRPDFKWTKLIFSKFQIHYNLFQNSKWKIYTQ